MSEFQLALSPGGRVYVFAPGDSSAARKQDFNERLEVIRTAFEESSATGLLKLATSNTAELSAEFGFWKRWSSRLLQDLCHLDEQQREGFCKCSPREPIDKWLPPPDELALAVTIAEAPPMRGLEYLTSAVLKTVWVQLANLVREQATAHSGGLTGLLKDVNPEWQLLGRVTFHLAENKKDPARPFAFLATYAHRLTTRSTVQHLPLAEALRQYANEKDQAKLAALLAPVRVAAEHSSIVRKWLDSRALFQPQSLDIDEAYHFLRDVPQMEQSGLVVRVPNWWRSRQASRPAVQIQLGEKKPRAMGVDALLDFSIGLALDGESLTAAEQKQLLAADDGLMLLRGKWVEVDGQRLNDALQHWRQLKSEHADGVGFLRGMRMLAGAALDDKSDDGKENREWAHVTTGKWLQEALSTLRDPSGEADCQPGVGLQATLRPYQVEGVRWLWFMTQLRLGACLADDMGLGKTIQVIDLLLRLGDRRTSRGKGPKQSGTSLLIVPASLIGNWKIEFARFAPQLRVLLAHRSEMDAASLQRLETDPAGELKTVDAVVTSYTMARNKEWFSQVNWNAVVLDEAQAIKNPSSSQSKSVKKIRSNHRIVLTGTPVENQLGDLWALFDFCLPGLLGSAKQFKDYVKRLGQSSDSNAYAALRRLAQPYILRRMKTDPAIVPDLPDKTEMRVECGLSKRQAVLYQQTVDDLQSELKSLRDTGNEKGIQRRGVVLSTMMRLKQICNHPAQVTANKDFPPLESGKFQQLAEICEPIRERQEKALVFTQFQSLCDPLSKYLATVFGYAGLVLHGGTPVKKRKDLVRRFQEDDTIPYFVISLKAGGTGLNLTAASHVIHFDRWWNPAVENQATDRAFRIGQKRNVLVHKFVCRGTLEERIDEMLRTKQELTDQILGSAKEGERLLSEMSDGELMNFVTLDVRSAGL